MRLVALLVVLAASFVAPAQDLPTAASLTEPGRTLKRPLEIVLGGGAKDAERTVMVIVDPSAGLVSAGFGDTFAAALRDNKEQLAKTKLGLGVAGQKGCVVVPPTLDHDAVLAALRTALAKPAGEFLDVYADVRAALPAFGAPGAYGGERVLLLVTLENGDVEDDVEQTATALHKAKVRCVVLASETTLADCYWAARPYQEKPRNTTLTGADNALIDVPWGWLFQFGSANEVAPAGFAMWGLTRLAAESGGKVFLHASSRDTQHQCAIHARCLFCTGDHLPPDDAWNEKLVAQLGPLAAARNDVYSAVGGDPAFRAMVEAWRAAAEAGLVHSAPGVRTTATGAEPDRVRPGRDLDLTDSASFDRHAKRAEEAAQKAQQIGEQLQSKLDRLEAGKCSPRTEAAARYTRVLLQITRVNLLMFASWCRDTAPGLFGKDAVVPLVPEVPSVSRDERPVGIGWSNFCLCHGVRPFFAVELPGKQALKPELEALDALYLAYQARYAKTQFGLLLRRNGLAQFWPTFPGNLAKIPRVRPKTPSDDTGPLTPRRPPREGGTAGGSSGPTTGGGK